MEDGEILSDDELTLPIRPSLSLPNSANFISINHGRNKRNPIDSESDSETDSLVTSRTSLHGNIPPNNSSEESNSFDGATESNRKKRNEVWKSVMFEQSMENDFKSTGLNSNSAKNCDRDVESYDFERAKFDDRPPEDVVFQPSCDDLFSVTDQPVDDLETFGKMETKPKVFDARERIKRNREKWKEARKRKQSSTTYSELLDERRKRAFSDDNEVGECNEDENEGEMDKHGKRRRGNEDYILVSVNDSLRQIVNALVVNLQEPKVELMKTIVDTLGSEKAIQLMKETIETEKNGGMLIADGSRRRTPGGTFIQLLKKDPDISKSQKQFIFKDDWNHPQKKHKKKNRKAEKTVHADFAKDLNSYLQSKNVPKNDEYSKANVDKEVENESDSGDIFDCDVTIGELEPNEIVLSVKMDEEIELCA